MAKFYFGFALASSMFSGDCVISRRVLSSESACKLLSGDFIPCLNPSHKATIAALAERFGVNPPIPEKPPSVVLNAGDSVLVMGVRGLPRLTDRHEYASEEIARATFEFVLYTVA
jgi:hypothetical protein